MTLCRRECFCGDERAASKKFSNNECNAKCQGSEKNECGGNWKIAVFETDIPGTVNHANHEVQILCVSNSRISFIV